MNLPGDLTARLISTQPRLAKLVAASSERLHSVSHGSRNTRHLERLIVAARTLGAERRMGPRLPLSRKVMLELPTGTHITTSVDIGRRGVMLLRPSSLRDIASTDASIRIAGLGRFAARFVAVDAQTLSLTFKPGEDALAHDALADLIIVLEQRNAEAIAVSIRFAADVAECFTTAVTEHKVSAHDLFASDLRRIDGTDPPQYDHPAMHFFETALPGIIARYHKAAPQVAYAVVTTRNCFVPIHIEALSQRQRIADLTYNHAFSRHRRIYDDRWTLRAAAFSQHPVVQAYRRDVPDGAAMLVRDVSAPIHVCKRHWGASQIAYLMTDNEAHHFTVQNENRPRTGGADEKNDT
jgi:methyl-accepting chemotaxis protein